jgi:hypothetical protein
MVNAGLLLAALQAVSTASPPVPNCALVTPRGDDIRFFIWTDEGKDDARLSPLPSAAWPRATVVGVRRMERGVRFDIGSREGFVFELGAPTPGEAQRTATLFLRRGQYATLPVAYGYCQDAPVTIDPPEPGDQSVVGADDPAFDPDLWPDDDCGLVLGDGRRTRFTFRLQRSAVRLQSADLWSGRPVTTPISWSPSGNVGLFSQRGGFGGIQTMTIRGNRAVKLIRLSQLGERSPPDLNGYGICGYRRIERRGGTQ